MRKLFLPILIALLAACTEKETWCSDDSMKLEFSKDTVAFDTIVATVGSSTKTLVVYNKNKKGIRVESVKLGKGTSSPFRINADGQFLPDGYGEDFEIRHEDSLVVRIEATPPSTGQDAPLGYEDVLLFQLESGLTQKVTLSVGSQDVHFFHAKSILCDTTLCSGKPYVVYDSLVVAAGATLSLEPGVKLMFHDKAGLIVHGTLMATGTEEKPIVFRGDRMDHMFDYLPYDNTPNRWEGIHICGESKNNLLSYCDIHSGCYGIRCDSTSLEQTTLNLQNSVIHNIGGNGLELNNCLTKAYNSQISNTFGYTVYMFGGASEFVHCTIAQFYPFDADRGDALYLANQEGDNYRHIQYAHFINSVITGYAEDVIMGSITEGQDEQCDYLFDHCFLKTIESDDTLRFSQITYDTKELELMSEDNFTIFDTDNFIYDFTPDSLSPIRNMGDPKHIEKYPVDRLGRSRTMDEGPDVGCYEYIAP